MLAAERGAARTALAWMAYTVAVDSIDGTLARALEVKRVLPIVDGTRLDDIVDYFTYVVVPALFLLHLDLLPAGAAHLTERLGKEFVDIKQQSTRLSRIRSGLQVFIRELAKLQQIDTKAFVAKMREFYVERDKAGKLPAGFLKAVEATR